MDEVIISEKDANEISQAIKSNPQKNSIKEKHMLFHGWKW